MWTWSWDVGRVGGTCTCMGASGVGLVVIGMWWWHVHVHAMLHCKWLRCDVVGVAGHTSVCAVISLAPWDASASWHAAAACAHALCLLSLCSQHVPTNARPHPLLWYAPERPWPPVAAHCGIRTSCSSSVPAPICATRSSSRSSWRRGGKAAGRVHRGMCMAWLFVVRAVLAAALCDGLCPVQASGV